MEINFIALFTAAAVTLLVGFIWYNPKVFGTIWMKEAGLTPEALQNGNMLKIFGLTYFLSLMTTMILMGVTIHQSGAIGMIGGPPMIENVKPSFIAFMTDYGTAYRTFTHGALHGFMTGLFLALPLIGINGLFEKKSWKYILINSGYWIITFTLMGGIICAYA